MSVRPAVHLAIPVDDLDAARGFYGGVLGLAEGRSTGQWVDWDLHGHQLVTHVVPGGPVSAGSSSVDGQAVPIPHFGLLLSTEDFHALADRLRAAGTDFVIEPCLRFRDEPAEQWTMFLHDPAGNALEFKAFRDESKVFAR
ncbi:VOC family protein [Streptomyces sp. PSAA01]|uniref:VOC family protein n=1 Tax=Streptomyces sp. PSAA01 TaxID=2912762 RepID=UPI001F18E3C6|nr:VOC family protein [Streptomyces sp. PSAA01]MCG0283647.1 VOC family protein [Streptomyces sp. PSAA01]